MTDPIETIREGEYVIRIYPDEYVESPRAPIYVGAGKDRKPVYPAMLSVLRVKPVPRTGDMGDGDLLSDDYEALDRGGWPLLARLVRCRDKAIVVVPLDVHADWRSVLAVTDDGDNADGYAVVTQANWRELMGDEAYDADKALAAVKAEVEEYNQWAEGDVFRYVITRKHDADCEDNDCGHDEDVDSLSNLYGLDYAISEAKAAIPVAS